MMKMVFVLVSIMLLFTTGCEEITVIVDNDSKNSISEPVREDIKTIKPFKDRKFIYNNPIKVEYKEDNTTDDNRIKTRYTYPVIAGLKDKAVEEKINKEIQETAKSLLSQLEEQFRSSEKEGKLRIQQKYSNSFISYSFNNVIFVDYNASIDVPNRTGDNHPRFNTLACGYDLNTGNQIELKDLFIGGYDYETKLNNYICQLIIDNNYDDFETERMKKPFQGIRENQSFSLSFDFLRIVLDEKNDEFVDNDYPESIFIPLKEIQDGLYIFDRYFEEGKNIFERARLTKKLLPNEIEFLVNKYHQENSKEYYIEVMEGKFINVPNKDIEKKLNEMVINRLNINAFKEKAKTVAAPNRMSHYNFYVNIFMNAGGYVSIATTEFMVLGNEGKNAIKPFNYDFNKNKELLIEDIYSDKSELEAALKREIRNRSVSIEKDFLDRSVKEAVKANKFYFDEYGITIYFSPESIKLEEYDKWIWIPFDGLNQEKVRFLY